MVEDGYLKKMGVLFFQFVKALMKALISMGLVLVVWDGNH